MIKKLLLITFIAAMLAIFPACSTDDASGSLKTITNPYIAQYECVEAKLGTQDLLENFEYIRITFLDKSELEVSYKSKNGDRKATKGAYKVDPETRELSGEIGFLGYKFKETTKIENGQFTIKGTVFYMPLVMKFAMK